MAIEEIPIRAQIYTGGVLLAQTPYISNFSVNKSRGQFSTFSASVKIKAEEFAFITKDISIYAGPKDNIIKIFTGNIKKAVPNPSWDDPSYLIVNLTGTDALAELEDKKFTRRQTYSKNSWAKIDSIVRKGPKSGKFKYVKEPVVYTSDGDFKQSSSGPVVGGVANTKSYRKVNENEKDQSTYQIIRNVVATNDTA